jgi:hypothetical protein
LVRNRLRHLAPVYMKSYFYYEKMIFVSIVPSLIG